MPTGAIYRVNVSVHRIGSSVTAGLAAEYNAKRLNLRGVDDMCL